MKANRHRRAQTQQQSRTVRAELAHLVTTYGAAQKEVLDLLSAWPAAWAEHVAGDSTNWRAIVARFEGAEARRDIAEWYANVAHTSYLRTWALRRRLDYLTAPAVRVQRSEFLARLANAAR